MSLSLTMRTNVQPSDVAAVRKIISTTGMFRPNEIDVAAELVEERLAHGESSGYYFLFAELAGEVVGYVCFGPIEVTLHSYDIYWIAVLPEWQGNKIGQKLLAAAEQVIAERGGRQIYIETSGRADYAATRTFYERCSYEAEATIRHFYAPDDDKVIFVRRIGL
jgi:GNAT superfamily N-acetyltransferase